MDTLKIDFFFYYAVSATISLAMFQLFGYSYVSFENIFHVYLKY